MSGTAKARNKARARRGPGRTSVEERAAAPGAGTATLAPPAPPAPPADARGAVPAPRPMPGATVPAQGPVRLSVVADPPARSEEARFGHGDPFARGYAAPADAVRCAMLGSPPTFWFEGDAGRLTISVESGRLTAVGVAHIGEDLAQLVAAVLLNHEGETADAVEPMRAALAELATSAGQSGAEVTVDLSGPSPRLGWLSRFDPAPWVTWHDWWAAFTASPAGRTAAAYGAAGAGEREVDACFTRQGLRVVRCAEPGCQSALTDRHPAWPGVWSAVGGMLGPVCAVAAEARSWPAGLLTALPHRVAEG